MIDSPLDSLYYMIKSVFTPALRDNKLNTTTNYQVQSSLSELEQVLCTVGKKGGSSSSMLNIFYPRDEIDYWIDITRNASNKSKDVERAKHFLELFDPIKKDFDKFEK